jgi:hypothetical protein
MQVDPRIGIIDHMCEIENGVIVGSSESGLVTEITTTGKMSRDPIEAREDNDPPISAMALSRFVQLIAANVSLSRSTTDKLLCFHEQREQKGGNGLANGISRLLLIFLLQLTSG